MTKLNLEAKNAEHQILKDYLEKNASEILAEKINNGVKIEKDGKSLINKKDLNGFMEYASAEAQKLAEKGARFACIKSDTVFNWAIHYFEEDSIEGFLYNEDGTPYKQPKPDVKKTVDTYTPPAPKPKPQMSLFDLMTELEPPTQQIKTEENKQAVEPMIEKPNVGTDDSNDDDEDGFTEEEMQEVLEELALEAAAKSNPQIDYETGEILSPVSDETNEVLQKLLDIFRQQITVR